jgi:hypothetical protein
MSRGKRLGDPAVPGSVTVWGAAMGVGLPLRKSRRPGFALRVLSALIVLLLYLPASRFIAPHASAQEWSAPRTV